MGWMTDRLADKPRSSAAGRPCRAQLRIECGDRVVTMMAGFQRDVEEFNTGKSKADFKELSPHEGGFSNDAMKIAVVVTAPFPSNHPLSIRAGATKTAVPEEGVLPCASRHLELNFSDQHLNSEAARRLILEPLFFANPPLEATLPRLSERLPCKHSKSPQNLHIIYNTQPCKRFRLTDGWQRDFPQGVTTMWLVWRQQ